MTGKKVFISYSWSSPAHESWVLELSQRLVHDGVDVILDKWNLKEGHDKYAFMESMVHATDIDKVLVILDKAYCDKANDRAGGVGTETTIISAKVYGSTTQEKFIPVVAACDDEGKAYLPVYLEGKIYIDLSKVEHFESGYEKLLRNIYQLPSLAKPKLGSPPKYLLEESPVSYKTTSIVRGFESQIDKNPGRINSITRDFLDEIFNNLTEFRLPPGSCRESDFGEVLYNNLNKYTPLRNDFVDFMLILAKLDEGIDLDIIVRFFERLPSLLNPSEGVSSWFNNDFINFKFMINELFIYTIAVALKKDNAKMLAHFLHSRYFVLDRYKSADDPSTFATFYANLEGFDNYYKTLTGKTNLVNPHADFLVSRIPDKLTKTDLLDADLFCGIIADLENWRWFPRTYVYRNEDSRVFPILNRLLSKRHFEKVKIVFDIDTPEELTKKINSIAKDQSRHRGYSNSWHRMPGIEDFIDENKIATVK